MSGGTGVGISPTYYAIEASGGGYEAPDHVDLLSRRLNYLAYRHIKRLLISMPPRHGKSQTVSRYFPGYYLGNFPNHRVMLGSYEADFAATWGRKARDDFDRTAPRVFGLRVDPNVAAISAWNVAAVEGGPWDGCGFEGGMETSGVGGGFTGRGAHLLVLDDLVKNAEEAQSEVQREKVWDFFTSTAYTRLEPDGVIAGIATRWHEDDWIGRIEAQIEAGEDCEPWEIINIPAVAEEDDPLGRPAGAALWPERYPIERLLAIRNQIGDYWFDALYQGRPRPKSGGFFKEEWFNRNAVSAAPLAQMTNLCRYWDRAASEGKGDWTAGVLMGRTWDGTYYIIDCQRARKSSAGRDKLIMEVARTDAEHYGRQVPLMIRGEQEPGSAGKDAALAFVKMLAGYDVRCATVTGDKESRARPYSAQAEISNVKMVEGPWNRAFVTEHASFPFGKHDDQVDAASGAFNALGGAVVAEWGESPLAGWRGGRSYR